MRECPVLTPDRPHSARRLLRAVASAGTAAVDRSMGARRPPAAGATAPVTAPLTRQVEHGFRRTWRAALRHVGARPAHDSADGGDLSECPHALRRRRPRVGGAQAHRPRRPRRRRSPGGGERRRHRRGDRRGPGAVRRRRLPGRDRRAAGGPQRHRQPAVRGRAQPRLRPLRRRRAPGQHPQAGVRHRARAGRGWPGRWTSTSTRSPGRDAGRSRSTRTRPRSRCSASAGP